MSQNNHVEDQPLYDRKLIKDLDFTKLQSLFNPSLSVAQPGEGLRVRPLQASDYDAGFTQVLGQLTSTGDVSQSEFIKRFRSMQACADTYYVTVVEDCTLGRVIGAATLLLEQKFIHNCALRGRIEDVVVDDRYRGKQLGKLLLATLVLLAERLGVYKLTLDCRDHMVPFYQTFGLDKEPGNSNFMQIRFKN